MLQFMSLASGSSGNCYYVGTPDGGILIDAGVAFRTIVKRLDEACIATDQLLGVLVTHDHADHIKGLGTLCKKISLPIYVTEKVRQSLINHKAYGAHGNFRVVQKNSPMQIGSLAIEAFEVPHDATDNVGYFIRKDNVSLCIITDLGHVTDVIAHYALQANYLVLESNHDIDMLCSGSYPPYLKSRILGSHGHLSNIDAANFVTNIFTPQLKHIWLCHLSRDNNEPELAVQTMESALCKKVEETGHRVGVTALPRFQSTPLYKLE